MAAMPKSFPDGHRIDWHRHPRAQLLFAIKGTMSIRTPRQLWVVPPLRALWVPAITPHEVTMSGSVEMRTLYVEPAQARGLAPDCVAIEACPLLRELIVRATEMPTLYDDSGADGLVIRLLLDEISRAPVLPLSLPLPDAGALAGLCAQLLAEPSGGATLVECARAAGISSRTLARRFIEETGLTFGQWRQRARVQAAIARLSDGENITAVALDLGYESPSAFAAMFRRTMGMPPSALSARRAGKLAAGPS